MLDMFVGLLIGLLAGLYQSWRTDKSLLWKCSWAGVGAFRTVLFGAWGPRSSTAIIP